MDAIGTLRAAGETDPGLRREVNEDRFHVDAARGLFMVIDGVGGQAAGGRAADTAVSVLRVRLERENGSIPSRLRDAIATANNEIHRLAGLRAEWRGMACVLTAVVVRDGHAIVGHVGDTRLYKLRHGQIDKVTRDHSPVGEREDAREISERDAMQHPRRNEVYRDVGSEPHEPGDPDFIDVQAVTFEPDAALLLCSDGLTDVVDSATINAIVKRWAGRPREVVRALIDAANGAGGKDNITVVYVEGERFPPAVDAGDRESANEITRRLGSGEAMTPRRRLVRLANIVLIAVVIVLALVQSDTVAPPAAAPESQPPPGETNRIVVASSGSIGEALQRARAGATIVVDPGEYRETITLKSHVRLVSRDPHAAVIRLPGTAAEGDAAIVARGIVDASLDGFRIVGDAATPLGTAMLAVDADLTMSQVEITGAAHRAVDVGAGSHVRVVAGDIHDNPGSAIRVRSGAWATIAHSVFARNATAANAARALLIEDSAHADFTSNVFVGSTAATLAAGSGEARAQFARDNWFVTSRPPVAAAPAPRSR
ncbi:MAG TPA: protein phosphatase 2C domain-containing protein [Vicinamibacterales bacterium]|nr:protein phosphatase 2C domain-containing protein [Vicinamibacterales bacterium]